jgi:hypothetical protein
MSHSRKKRRNENHRKKIRRRSHGTTQTNRQALISEDSPSSEYILGRM